MSELVTFDWIVILLYFIAVFAVAIWATQQDKKRLDTSAGYFLAGRNAGWFVIGASLFASNIGSEHLIGLAGTGFSSGVAVGQFEILASLILLILGWVFVPFYLRSGVYTMPEFLERRYSEGARFYLSIMSILGYVLTKISVTVVAAGIVFESLLGIGFWTGAITVVIATGIYTVFGGLRAVIYTDMLQMIVLILGSLTVTFAGLNAIGGWDVMVSEAGSDFLTLWKPMSDPDFPWTGILFGAPILGVWYWCTDQFIVQRVLSARNISQARKGTIFGGFLKVLPLFIFVIPGVIASVLVSSGKLSVPEADAALPVMIGALLPVGLRGLVVAGLLAALMSSLSSVFNSCSTLITLDLYKKVKPSAGEKELVWAGQIATVVLVIFGLLWIPIMRQMDQIYVYLQSVQAYIAPPIASVFLLGVFFKRLNARGAMAALMSGFVLGMLRLFLEVNQDSLTAGSLMYQFTDINFLHFAALLFVVCSAILVGASLTSPAPVAEKVAGLTFQSSDTVTEDDTNRSRDLLLTALLIAVVGAVWLYFS